MCLCDAFNLPVIFLMDVPGFMVGKAVEHDRILSLAIRFVEALGNMSTPTLTVTLRKGFGLAFPAMNGWFRVLRVVFMARRRNWFHGSRCWSQRRILIQA